MKFAKSKGHNSCKNGSIVTKLELDLYHLEIYSHTKNECNTCNNSEKKSGKLKCDRQTDRRTDRRTDGQTNGVETISPLRRAGRGLNKRCVNYSCQDLEIICVIFSVTLLNRDRHLNSWYYLTIL